MAFLVWKKKEDADDSLAALNTLCGLPIQAENGYKMERWDFVVKSNLTRDHGFYKPEQRPGMVLDDVMAVLTPGFTEHEIIPDEFVPEDKVD